MNLWQRAYRHALQRRSESRLFWILCALIGAAVGMMIAIFAIFAPVIYVTSAIIRAPVIKELVSFACSVPLLDALVPGAACDLTDDGQALVDAGEESGLNSLLRAYFDCANNPAWQREAGLCDPNALAQREGGAIPAEKGWLIPVFVEAGRQHDVPWQLVAAVAGARGNFGEENCSPGGKVAGFMGFTKKEWDRFGRDAGSTVVNIKGDDPSCWELRTVEDVVEETDSTAVTSFEKDGLADSRDPVDAIFSYAALLSANGVKGAREWKYNGSPSNSCAVDEALDGKVFPAPVGSSSSGGSFSGVGPATYPGDNAPIEQRAAWMAGKAVEAGLPPELPVIAALVETGGLIKNINYGHADSVGFFQMRTSIWNSGAYAGYPEDPELQIKWFIDQALKVKAGNTWKNKDLTEANYGEFVADVERPAAEYRGRYQTQLPRAKELLAGGLATTPVSGGGGAGSAGQAFTGTFDFPIDGAHNYTNDWGAPRSDGRGGHKGTDIFANRGTPVVAVAKGELRQVGNDGGLGGNRLWLESDAGPEFYYAHLAGYAPGIANGSKVNRGQVIAYVGNTGNAATTPPHLHFEIHPSGYDSATNPFPMLRSWEQGSGSSGGSNAVPGTPASGGSSISPVTAQYLTEYLTRKRPRSPLLPHIGFIVSESQAAGVDPRMVLAIAGAESQFATDSSNAASLKNAWGLGPHRQYASWEKGIQALLRTLVNYRKDGLDTIKEIQERYCPVGADNDSQGVNSNWLPNVTALYAEMGGDPTGSVHSGGGDDYTDVAGSGGSSTTTTTGGPYSGTIPTDKVSKALRVRYGETEPHSWCYVSSLNGWYEAIKNGVSASDVSGGAGGPLLEQYLAALRAQVGKPYIWGAAGPETFDCSGLFSWGFGEIGRPFPNGGRWTTYTMRDAARAHPDLFEEGTDWSKIRPGDMVLSNGYGHVVTYIGDDQYLHASGGQACPGGGARCKVVIDDGFAAYSSKIKWVRFKPFWEGNQNVAATGDTSDVVWVQAGHEAPREPGYAAQTGATGEIGFTTTLQKLVIDKLKAKGIDARAVAGKVDPVNAEGAAFVSLHHDAPASSGGRGFAGYAIAGTTENYYAGDGIGSAKDAPVPGAVVHRTPASTVSPTVETKSRALARLIDMQMRRIDAVGWTGLGQKNKAADRRAMRYYGFYRTKAQSRVLVEAGTAGSPFLSRQPAIATAITNAVVAHLEDEG